MQSITLQTNDTAVAADDQLGQIQFAASSESDGGAATNVSAKIEAVAEAAFQSASHATALTFSTATSDANAPGERVRISNDGKVGLGTATPASILHVKGEYADGAHITIEDTSSALKTRFYNGNSASVVAVDEGDAVGSSSFIIQVDGDNKGTFGASATTFDQNVTINSSTNQAIIGNSVTVFNEGGANIDFRIEGDTDANLLFLDASKDSVIIGNSTDGSVNSKLHVEEVANTNTTNSRTINILGRGYSTTDGTYYHIANNSRAEKYLSASTTDGGYCIGLNAVPVIYSPDGTNTLAELTAVRANPSINSAASNVTVTNAYDIKTVPYFQGTNNTVTNHYGLYLGDAGAGGTTPTNEYGVYQVNTAATNYFGGTLDVRGAAVFNEGGAAVDFRVEGDTDTHLLFVDGSEDKVGIGTNSPAYTLHIDGDIGLTNQGFYASPTGVMIGVNGWTYNDGQTTLSHGRFGEDGDAQNSSYVLRCTTSNATFTTAQNNGADIVLASNRTMMFSANIVGRRTDQVNATNSDNAAYTLKGLLHNDGYGAALVGSVTKTVIAETDSNWDVQAVVAGAGAGGTDKLNIQVKGASSKTVNWVVKLELLEVGGDVSGYTETNILGKIDTEELP